MLENRKEKNTEPLVSIIIPVYNDEKYIRNCLESIIQQTVSFWEAWLVDDCSEDNSIQIIEEYCKKDSRFHMLCNNVNSSAWVGRARGILSTSDSVKYILFADADDTLQPNMVERAYELMEEEPVDILHFGTNVENCSKISRRRIRSYTEYLQPPLVKLEGLEIFNSFVERKFEGHLWNKMFKSKLLKDVINSVGVYKKLPKAQDKALYWAICWYRKDLTYRGVADRLYNYNYGLGVEGAENTITLEQYQQYLSQAYTEDFISDIMEEHPEESKQYTEVMENSRYNLIKHSIKNYLRLLDKDKSLGIDNAATFWSRDLDAARITCALAEYTWNNQIETEKVIENTQLFTVTKKGEEIKTIGTYYHRMDNGGIQRVIAKLMIYWHNAGYNVILFTDCEPTPKDYELPEYITRVKIARPFSKCKNTNYYERGMSLGRLLLQYKVDCMVYHSYFSDVLLYDTCICKGMNIPFVIYQHNVFTRFLRYNEAKFSTIPIFSRLADAVACLDKMDKQWFECFNKNVHLVLNPLTFELDNIVAAPRNKHNILFLGRLVEEAKRPNDAITIAQKVIDKIPDAKMYIVGISEDSKYQQSLVNRIKDLQMEDKIIMCGFYKDVEMFYYDCSVFLSCSTHEGFMLTLCEAMSFNIPIVMYELPYLATVDNNPGVVSVPQGHIEAAVDAICDLFQNPEKLKKTGDRGRKYLEEMYKIDIKKQWIDLFNSINSVGTQDCYNNGSYKLMAETIVRDYISGVQYINKKWGDQGGKLEQNPLG